MCVCVCVCAVTSIHTKTVQIVPHMKRHVDAPSGQPVTTIVLPLTSTGFARCDFGFDSFSFFGLDLSSSSVASVLSVFAPTKVQLTIISEPY